MNFKFPISNFKINNCHCETRRGVAISLKKIASSLALLAMTWCVLLLVTSPAYAQVNIGQEYGYGYLKNLGEGINKLVTPTFSIAMAVVIFYFLIGAFRLLMSGGEKETVASSRSMITHAIIGFIILMFAFLILQFVLSSLFGITSLRVIN